MAYGGVLSARRRQIPWIVEYNGDPLADLAGKGAAPQGLQRKIAVFLFRKSMRAANHVIASGEGWRRSCIETWDVDAGKVTTIENGTNLLDLLQRGELASFRQTHPAEEPVEVVYLGGFYPWHGIDVLLESVALAIRSGTKLHLTLIGAGDGFTSAQQRASDLGLGKHVHFTGRLSAEEYASYLAKAEIGVSPYCGWEEFSGLKIFDYKAAGLACIASGQDGQPKTIQHGITGWIIPPCDSHALATALIEIVGNLNLRRQLGRAARIEAECIHSWKHTVDQLDSVFLRWNEV
jgi:glycosyltransferase involved in cell wall biosynthesis